MILVLVAAAGAFGALARDAVDRSLGHRVPDGGLPWATLVVNVSGSFALGWLAAARPNPGDGMLLALGGGFLGAFTTFSTFAVQAARLPARRGLTYVGVTVAGCVVAAAVGLRLA